MGKGDKKSKRGKIIAGSYGKSRMKKESTPLWQEGTDVTEKVEKIKKAAAKEEPKKAEKPKAKAEPKKAEAKDMKTEKPKAEEAKKSVEEKKEKKETEKAPKA